MLTRLFAATVLVVLAAALIQKRVDVTAAKGKFMVHMLHSAYFFPETVEVKWSASAQGKPILPVWLHLFRSRHHAIAYLIGTPVTPLTQVTIHVIAKRLDNYRSAEQFVTINLNDDVRFNSSTRQIVELRVRNAEAEDFIETRDGKIRRLEKAIHETFRGKGVNPYIYDLFPEIRDLPDDFHQLAGKRKIATIVQVGTQRGFHPNVHNIADGLNRHPDYCEKSSYIPMNKHFRDAFDIDWCKFELRNVTTVKALEEYAHTLAAQSPHHRADKSAASQLLIDKARSRSDMEDMDALYRSNYPLRGQSLFESVLVFPLLAALCIILLIVLSLIFFGRREGQHWRDYKTPKERMQEYLDVRESQRHLREMSVQRQMLFMSDEPGKSATPISINTFLQPRQPFLASSSARPPPPPSRQSPAVGGYPNGDSAIYLAPRVGALSASQPRLPSASSPALSYQRLERRANSSVMASPAAEVYRQIGKQTVAEAARATGSSLELYRYRNPLDDVSTNNDNYYDAEKTSRLGQRPANSGNGVFSNYRSRPMLGDTADYRYSTVR